MYHLLPLLWSRSHASDLLLNVDQINWYMYLISHVRQSEGLSTYPESLLLKPSLLILWFWSSLLPLFAAITPSKALQNWSVTSLWIFFVAVRSSYNPAVVVDHFEISGNIIFFQKKSIKFSRLLIYWANYSSKMIKLYILSTTLFLLYQKLFARFRKETLVPRWKTLIRENKEGFFCQRDPTI